MDKKTLCKILYYGSLWGIAEATLGYVLHAAELFSFIKISGSIMFPIGVLCMHKAFTKTNKTHAIMLTSLVAALIKSINIIIPNATVVNPVMAILLQGLAVYLIMPSMLKGSEKRLLPLFSMGFAVTAAWRLPFFYIPFQLGINGRWQLPIERIMPFLTRDVLFSTLFIMLFFALASRLPERKNGSYHERFAFVPMGAFSVFAAAMILEYFIP